MRQSKGYTLVEALVMLAIVAVVSTLVLEAIRMATSSGVRIERVARNAVHDHLDFAAVRSAVAATRITYHDETGGFSGTRHRLAGKTDAPVASELVANSAFLLQIENSPTGSRLTFSEGSNRWEVANWPNGSAEFAYWDAREDGEWSATWPPGELAPAHYAPVPSAVRIRIAQSGRNSTIVLELVHSSPPPLRVVDLVEGLGN